MSAAREALVRGALAFDFAGLDPVGTASAGAVSVLRHVHEPLIRRDRRDGPQEPGLLTALPRRIGESEHELVLREGVCFHDGTPVTGEDLARSLVAQQEADNPKARVLANHLAVLESMAVTDARTVVLRAQGSTEVIAERLRLLRVLPGGQPAGHLGTGPYRITQADDRDVRLEAFAGYRGPRRAVAPDLALQAVVDGGERLEGLRAGVFDMIEDPPAGRLEELREDPRWEVAVVQGQVMPWVIFNHGRPPFDDVRVREAIAHAIDREALARVEPGGLLRPSATHLPAGHPDHAGGLSVPAHDPARARLLLREAGAAGAQLDLFVSEATWVAALAPELVRQLGDIGLEVRLRTGATSTFFATDGASGNYSLALCSGDPSELAVDGAFLLSWYLAGGWPREYLHRTDSDLRSVEVALSEATTCPDPERGRELLVEVQQQTAAQYPMLVLGHRAQPTAWSAELAGVRPGAGAGLDLVGVHRAGLG